MTKEKEAAPVNLNLPELPENLESFTGETVRVPRLEVPLIRVSYKAEDDDTKICPKGEFIEYSPVTKEILPLGKKISIQILHHRQSLSAYKNEESYWTPEISMKERETSLFLGATNNGKRSNTFLMKGPIDKKSPGSLRAAYPDLRYQRNLYVLHDGVLKSLVIYGASFSGFIDLTKELKGQSSSTVSLELSTKKEKTGTVIYYPIVFTIKEKLDAKANEVVGKELAAWFAKYDGLIAQQLKERADQAAIDRGDGPDDKNSVYDHTPAAKPSTLPPARPAVPAKPDNKQQTLSEQVKDADEEGDKIDPADLPF